MYLLFRYTSFYYRKRNEWYWIDNILTFNCFRNKESVGTRWSRFLCCDFHSAIGITAVLYFVIVVTLLFRSPLSPTHWPSRRLFIRFHSCGECCTIISLITCLLLESRQRSLTPSPTQRWGVNIIVTAWNNASNGCIHSISTRMPSCAMPWLLTSFRSLIMVNSSCLTPQSIFFFLYLLAIAFSVACWRMHSMLRRVFGMLISPIWAIEVHDVLWQL